MISSRQCCLCIRCSGRRANHRDHPAHARTARSWEREHEIFTFIGSDGAARQRDPLLQRKLRSQKPGIDPERPRGVQPEALGHLCRAWLAGPRSPKTSAGPTAAPSKARSSSGNSADISSPSLTGRMWYSPASSSISARAPSSGPSCWPRSSKAKCWCRSRMANSKVHGNIDHVATTASKQPGGYLLNGRKSPRLRRPELRQADRIRADTWQGGLEYWNQHLRRRPERSGPDTPRLPDDRRHTTSDLTLDNVQVTGAPCSGRQGARSMPFGSRTTMRP